MYEFVPPPVHPAQLLHGIVLGVLLWLACVLQPVSPLLPFAVLASWWLATLEGWETR